MYITDRKKLIELTQLDKLMDETTDAEEYEEMAMQSKRLWINLEVEVEVFEHNGKWGLRTKHDSNKASVVEITPAIYDVIVLDDLGALACIGRQWTLILDIDKQQPLAVECDEVRFTEDIDLLKLRVGDKWGLYHIEKQQWKAMPEYDEIVEQNAVFLLRQGNKWGYASARWFIPAEYDRIRLCRCSGFVRFYLGAQSGFIDKNGKWTQDASNAAIWMTNYNDILKV